MIFLLGMALVFGAYYLWSGLQGFISSGGLPIFESTEQAMDVATATARQVIVQQQIVMTPFPTNTPFPECQDFIVDVPSAVVRERPSTASLAVDSLAFGEIVCVIEQVGENSDWYRIDLNRATRRIEDAYMHADIIEALNPTATPTLTFTPAPTVTAMPTPTRTRMPSPEPTNTRDPNASATPSPTAPPTPTTSLQSA